MGQLNGASVEDCIEESILFVAAGLSTRLGCSGEGLVVVEQSNHVGIRSGQGCFVDEGEKSEMRIIIHRCTTCVFLFSVLGYWQTTRIINYPAGHVLP